MIKLTKINNIDEIDYSILYDKYSKNSKKKADYNIYIDKIKNDARLAIANDKILQINKNDEIIGYLTLINNRIGYVLKNKYNKEIHISEILYNLDINNNKLRIIYD